MSDPIQNSFGDISLLLSLFNTFRCSHGVAKN
jgi:hypothetical protein